MDDLHRNYIDGDWVDGEAVADINPSNTDDVVGHYARGTAADAQRAIAAAKAAFPAWSRSGIQQRHDILKAAGDEIMARREELGRLLKAAGYEDDDTAAYTRYGSARQLYHFHVENSSVY